MTESLILTGRPSSAKVERTNSEILLRQNSAI
jgi:hypothetical protein